jgi:predicted SnoaL-like aldol condensation-catalyzing enzyme
MQTQTDQNKSLIKQMFRDMFESDSFDERVIDRYFSPGYVQHADGTTLTFSGFVDHVRELKWTVAKLEVTFEQMVAEGNKVMEIHRVKGEKRDGSRFTVRLMSFWIIEDGKIALCDELSHLEQGAPEDRDLGSCTSTG